MSVLCTIGEAADFSERAPAETLDEVLRRGDALEETRPMEEPRPRPTPQALLSPDGDPDHLSARARPSPACPRTHDPVLLLRRPTPRRDPAGVVRPTTPLGRLPPDDQAPRHQHRPGRPVRA